MIRQCMTQPDCAHIKSPNEMPSVPEMQNKAKSSKEDAVPIISGISAPSQKVFRTERPVSKAYKMLDNDLARDNVENDLPDADLQDL